MRRGRPIANCRFGKSIYWLDPEEQKVDYLTARWIIERPLGQNQTSIRGFRFNDKLDGFLVRDETEARNFSAALEWKAPKPFSPEKDEKGEGIVRPPYMPSNEQIAELPMEELRDRSPDNLLNWPYDALVREADMIKTSAAEVPQRPTRHQLIQFIRDKRDVRRVAAEQAQVERVVAAAREQMGV